MNMREIPNTAIEIQDGIMLVKTRYGSDIYAKDGYRFYVVGVCENYDENGDLVAEERRLWCTYMSCVWKTVEEVNANIVGAKKPFVYEETSMPIEPIIDL
jgi:hypothetical protein